MVNADTLSPDGIQSRLLELQKELIKKANNKQDYDATADEIFRLRDQKEQSEIDSHHREEAMNRIKELQDFIASRFSSARLSYASAIILSPDRSSLTFIFRSSQRSSIIPESGIDFPVSLS